MEDPSAVMDIFVREFCANCEGGAGSVSMRKHTLQTQLVKHMRPYLAPFGSDRALLEEPHGLEARRLEMAPGAVALGFAGATECT
ncbi:unnamed protein product [Lampetra fluviatilis]